MAACGTTITIMCKCSSHKDGVCVKYVSVECKDVWCKKDHITH